MQILLYQLANELIVPGQCIPELAVIIAAECANDPIEHNGGKDTVRLVDRTVALEELGRVPARGWEQVKLAVALTDRSDRPLSPGAR